MPNTIDLDDLKYELTSAALEKRRALFWEVAKKYPRWRDELLDFYVVLEND